MIRKEISMKITLSASQKNILEWIACIVIAIVLALFIKYFVGTPTLVNRTSMYPTLEPKDRLVLNRLARSFKQEPKRGDIITFEAPSQKQLPIDTLDITSPKAEYGEEPKGWWNRFRYYVLETEKTSYIKRVIALPGERVEIKEGKVYINGKELEESYLPEGTITESDILTNFVVPQGYFFAMGDNRGKSVDCRDFGCIPMDKLEGIVVLRFWPFTKFGVVN